jgi:hypothetical protein
MNRYAPPALSPRLIPVMRRHFLVWRKLALPSLLANVAEYLGHRGPMHHHRRGNTERASVARG